MCGIIFAGTRSGNPFLIQDSVLTVQTGCPPADTVHWIKSTSWSLLASALNPLPHSVRAAQKPEKRGAGNRFTAEYTSIRLVEFSIFTHNTPKRLFWHLYVISPILFHLIMAAVLQLCQFLHLFRAVWSYFSDSPWWSAYPMLVWEFLTLEAEQIIRTVSESIHLLLCPWAKTLTPRLLQMTSPGNRGACYKALFHPPSEDKKL